MIWAIILISYFIAWAGCEYSSNKGYVTNDEKYFGLFKFYLIVFGMIIPVCLGVYGIINIFRG